MLNFYISGVLFNIFWLLFGTLEIKNSLKEYTSLTWILFWFYFMLAILSSWAFVFVAIVLYRGKN